MRTHHTWTYNIFNGNMRFDIAGAGNTQAYLMETMPTYSPCLNIIKICFAKEIYNTTKLSNKNWNNFM